jgi:hypothetical protein
VRPPLAPATLRLGDTHPVYGTVTAVGTRDGEGFYMFMDTHGTVSLMPRELIDALDSPDEQA